ncbi:MAG: helix-turn-helix transcriptional regulator [Eubacterium sp.]|nr:helix-turn-helix transcriptional regulator [Eubacterium sp.]
MQPVLVPEKLKIARERLDITKVEAAKRMSIPQSSYVRYENGQRKPTHATIVQMAQVLGTSVDYLIGKTNDDKADTVIVHKENEPELYEIASGAQDFNEEQLNRLLMYYKEIIKLSKKKK